MTFLCESTKKDATKEKLLQNNRKERSKKYLNIVNKSESKSPTLATVDISLKPNLQTLSEIVEVRSKCYHKNRLKCTELNCRKMATNKIAVELPGIENHEFDNKASFSSALRMCEGLLISHENETGDTQLKLKKERAIEEQNEGEAQSSSSSNQNTKTVPKPPPIPANFTISIFVVTYLAYIAIYYIFSLLTTQQNGFIVTTEKIGLQMFELLVRYCRNLFPVYWLTKKDETRNFALHKIRMYLLRYLSQEKAETIMAFVDDNKSS